MVLGISYLEQSPFALAVPWIIRKKKPSSSQRLAPKVKYEVTWGLTERVGDQQKEALNNPCLEARMSALSLHTIALSKTNYLVFPHVKPGTCRRNPAPGMACILLGPFLLTCPFPKLKLARLEEESERERGTIHERKQKLWLGLISIRLPGTDSIA